MSIEQPDTLLIQAPGRTRFELDALGYHLRCLAKFRHDLPLRWLIGSLITSTRSSQKSFVQPRNQVLNSSFRFPVQKHATLVNQAYSALVVQDRWRSVIKFLVNH